MWPNRDTFQAHLPGGTEESHKQLLVQIISDPCKLKIMSIKKLRNYKMNTKHIETERSSQDYIKRNFPKFMYTAYAQLPYSIHTIIILVQLVE
jgi:hypothetical protein